jgi:protease I
MRVACLLADDFEDSEFRGPHDALRSAGHEVSVIGPEAGRVLPAFTREALTVLETAPVGRR